ncbi:MAG TPA: MFS transporter [Victivallales bacterium]|nr:MFS transporter [Victivallales bacterium]
MKTEIGNNSTDYSHLKWRVLIICSLGLFIDGFDLYISAVAEPFIHHQIAVGPLGIGLIQAAAPIGATIGAIFIGRLADKIGRKSMLMMNLAFFVFAAILSGFAWSAASLIFFRFLVGFGVGADYPICAAYISEMAPNKSRGKMAAFAMFMNCMAAPIGVLIALFIFKIYPNMNAWRIMLAIGAVPALVGLILRARLPESFVWKVQSKLARKSANIAKTVKKNTNWSEIFTSKYLKVTLAVCLCWFLMDISYYGIALFTPAILTALHFAQHGDFITATTQIVEKTLFLNVFIVVGALCSIFLIDKIGRIKLQKIGFLAAFAALFALGMTSMFITAGAIGIMLGCFILYNFFINFGPGITTWMIPAEVYPTNIRATGHGFAAGFAKFGAFIGAMLLPLIQADFGIDTVVLGLALTMILGMILTYMIPKETANLSIAEIDKSCEELDTSVKVHAEHAV